MATTTTRWWWIRHAPVPSQGHIYGQLDWPADVSDGAAFAGLARDLPREAIWVTSQLQRTRQTAEAILAARGATASLVTDPDLAEQHFGDYQGRPRDEVHAEAARPWSPFWLVPADTTPPGGESFEDLVARVRSAVDRLSRRYAGQDIVAVAHGGTIRAALAIGLNLPASHVLPFTIDNCSLTRLDHTSPEDPHGPALWRVVAVNRAPLSSGR